MRGATLAPGTVVALGLALLAATAHASDDRTERIAARSARIVQAVVETDPADADQRRSFVDMIAALPEVDRPAIVDALAQLEGGGGSGGRMAMLREALDDLGGAALQSLLTELGGAESTRHDRALVFWYVRDHDLDDGLALVLHAAASAGDADLLSPAIRGAIRAAVIADLRRGGVDWDDLGTALQTVDSSVQEIVIDGLEKGGFRISTRALGALLGADAQADASILRRLARMPVREANPLDRAALSRLSGYLQSDEPELRRLAVIVSARYRSQESISALVGVLDDEVAAVAATAHRVLCELSGARLHAESVLWLRWLDGERQWADKQGPRTAERLRSSETRDVLDAFVALTAHPLSAGDLVSAVEAATGHPDSEVRREACAVLATLGRFSSLPTLSRRLDDDDPTVVRAASEALARLTRLPAPARAAEWRDELLLDR